MEFIIKNPFDMHVHLRDEEMLKLVTPFTAQNFSGAVVMPNLISPIKTYENVVSYKKRILEACNGEKFTPFMTVFFHEELTRKDLEKLSSEILSIKLYPDGITTNSKGGIKDILSNKAMEIFKNMSDLGIILNIHGETNDFVMDRERNFIPIYEKLAQKFPNLKIIMEHITTKESAELVQKYDNLYATITLHHLYITLDDMAGGMLKPHLFCKPIAKKPEDREALLKLIFSGNSKVMFGSDSAPHSKNKKECSHCSAGIFTSPVSLQLLVELFEKNNALKNLQRFVSENAIKIYNLKNIIEKEIILEKKDFIIPKKYGDIIPFFSGRKITWSIK